MKTALKEEINSYMYKFLNGNILIFSSLLTEKIAEAGRKFTALKNELHVAGSLKVGPSLSTLATSRKVTLSPEPSNKVKVKTKKKVNQLKFAFGEFYLSLILLQNYQVGKGSVLNNLPPTISAGARLGSIIFGCYGFV